MQESWLKQHQEDSKCIQYKKENPTRQINTNHIQLNSHAIFYSESLWLVKPPEVTTALHKYQQCRMLLSHLGFFDPTKMEVIDSIDNNRAFQLRLRGLDKTYVFIRLYSFLLLLQVEK
jgi:hypothetical protein